MVILFQGSNSTRRVHYILSCLNFISDSMNAVAFICTIPRNQICMFIIFFLGMAIFLKNVSFHGILLDSLFDGDNAEWDEVRSLVSQGIEAGVVRPLPYSSYQKYEMEEAFRFMAGGKHIGKVVIEVRYMTFSHLCRWSFAFVLMIFHTYVLLLYRFLIY